MKLLLDTCVVSELQKADGDAGVREAIERARSEELFLSVITIGELTRGIELLPDGKRKRELEEWLRLLVGESDGRTLAVDGEVAGIWGRLTVEAQRAGQAVAIADGLIAATAIRHGLTVMTRNVRDFAATGAMVINPWQG